MEATDADVRRMLKRTTRDTRGKKRFGRSSGIFESSYAPVVPSAGFGFRGERGSGQWTEGWHTCAVFLWGDPDTLRDFGALGMRLADRISRATTWCPFDEINHRDGWNECVSYAGKRMVDGAPDETLVHDLQAIVDTYWLARKSSRPNVSSSLRRYRENVARKGTEGA